MPHPKRTARSASAPSAWQARLAEARPAAPAAAAEGPAAEGLAAVLQLAGSCLAPFTDIPTERQTWLIPGLVPADDAVLLAGRSQVGKSSFVSRLIGWATGGQDFADTGPPDAHGRALVYAPEEVQGGALKGRLLRAGASLARVDNGLFGADGRPCDRPALPDLLKPLSDRIAATRPLIVFLDPLTSFLVAGISMTDGPTIRRVVEALQRLARHYHCTILYSLHYRKSTAGEHSDWVAGSAEWWNVPRHIVVFGRDLRVQGRHIVSVAKQARGRPEPGWYYKIVDRDGDGYLELLGRSQLHASELVVADDDPVERSKRQLAAAYLRRVLEAQDEPKKVLIAECGEGGFSVHTLERAAHDLGVLTEFRVTEGKRAWWWCRPTTWLA